MNCADFVSDKARNCCMEYVDIFCIFLNGNLRKYLTKILIFKDVMRKIKYTGKLSDSQWSKIEPILSTSGMLNFAHNDYRLFVEAVLWVVLNNRAWSDLPSDFGKSKNVYTRFYRWNKNAIWYFLAHHQISDSELHGMLWKINDHCNYLNMRKEDRLHRLTEKVEKNLASTRAC